MEAAVESEEISDWGIKEASEESEVKASVIKAADSVSSARTLSAATPFPRLQGILLLIVVLCVLLKRDFNVLTGLFERISFREKTQNTVSMACHPCQAPSSMSVEAY